MFFINLRSVCCRHHQIALYGLTLLFSAKHSLIENNARAGSNTWILPPSSCWNYKKSEKNFFGWKLKQFIKWIQGYFDTFIIIWSQLHFLGHQFLSRFLNYLFLACVNLWRVSIVMNSSFFMHNLVSDSKESTWQSQ